MSDESKNQSGATAAGLSNKQLARAAQKELQDAIARSRVDALGLHLELESFGGKDDLEGSVVAVLHAYPDGLVMPVINQVIPAADAKLREELTKKGVITQKKQGQTWLLKLVSPAPEPVASTR